MRPRPPRRVDTLPETDAGLPGAGPIRRYDWFRDLWRERHAYWSPRREIDQEAVVFLGDSITQGWGDDLGGSFPGLRVANRGIHGDTSRGVLIRVEADVVALRPTAVVVLVGTNDIEEQADPATIAGNVELVLGALKADGRGAPVLLCEVFPSSPSLKRPPELIREVNRLYANLASADRQVTLVETFSTFADPAGNASPVEFPDLLHPNEIGYRKWAAALRPALSRVLASVLPRAPVET